MASSCAKQLSSEDPVVQSPEQQQTDLVVTGFECEFVVPPPEHLIQSECPVCLLIIRDPHQVTCCGKKFCGPCIQRLKASKIPCPLCNAKQFSNFPDKGLKQSLYSFKVCCSHQKDGCEWTGELGQLDGHLNTGCQFIAIDCPLASCECPVKLPRKDMPEHLRENLLTHFSLLATSHAKLLQDNRQLKSELKALQGSQQKTPRTTIPLGPPILTMTNFTEYKSTRRHWISPRIYTHHQGYKLCLRVDASGLLQGGKGTHIGVYVCFMGGEFDDSLKWPFRGGISIRLMDRIGGLDHKSYRLWYTDGVDDKYCSRVIEGGLSRMARGIDKFIAQADLTPKYLQNDSLQFQVHKVEF